MENKEILSSLPYSEPFLFVDEIEKIDEYGVIGTYTFRKNAFFYEGHFKDHPVTPGVILTECMAQAGVVCLGIFLLKGKTINFEMALTHTNIDFYLPIFPGENVHVYSEKVYFRFNKLKCRVKMHNSEGKLVGRGEIAGMIREHEQKRT